MEYYRLDPDIPTSYVLAMYVMCTATYMEPAGQSGGKYADFLCPLVGQAAEMRRSWRESNGSIDIKTPDRVISVDISKGGDEVAVSVEVVDQWTSASRQLVAEMMVMAGEAIASFGAPPPPRVKSFL